MYSGQRNQAPTVNELNKVQDLIESCLLHYMSHNEVVDTLKLQANVEPAFTKIVWQKLEEQNPEFFKAYNLRLMVKDQITQFNNLLEMQRLLMCQTQPADVAPVPMSNGSHVPPLHFDSGSYAAFHPRRMVSNDLPNTFFHANVSQNAQFAQNSNMGMIQGMNGLKMGSDVVHAGDTLMPYLQNANFSSSDQILRNLELSDFEGFANTSGDQNSFEDLFFDQDDFGSD